MHVAALGGHLHSPLQDEVAYVRSRKEDARQTLWHWLEGLSEPVDNGNISEDTLSIALSLSGGNIRASFFNVVFLEAFDARNSTSVLEIGLGGLLQSSTYISSLSGYVLGAIA